MPIYEYECPTCSFRFEQKRSFSDESPVSCPQCQCQAKRLFSPVPIIFKGSGFYVTDHRGNNSGSAPTGSPVTGSENSSEGKAANADTAKSGSTK